MSELVKGVLVHYDNRHIQIRWDFYQLCAYDKAQFNVKQTENGKIAKDEPNQECMAKILRVIETLTDHRHLQWQMDAQNLKEQGLNPPQEPKEYPVELSYGAISALLYSTYGESIIRNSVAVLIARGYLKRYQATKNSIPCYVLNIDVLQEAMKRQAEQECSGVEIDSHTQVSKSTAKPSKSTAEVSKSTAKPSKSTAEVSKSTPIIYSNNNKNRSNKEKEVRNGAAFADTTPHTLISHPLHDFLFLDDEVAPTVLTVFLTSKEYESEMEDKRRGHLADEVQYELAQRGHQVTNRWLHETEHETVEAATSHTPLPEKNEDVTQATPTGSGETVSDRGKEHHDRDDTANGDRADHRTPGSDRDDAPLHSHSSPRVQNRTAHNELPTGVQPRTRANGKRTTPPIKPDLFESAPKEVQAVITEWRAIFNKPVPVTPTLLEHATTLAAFKPEPGEIAQCRLWMYQTDKWYRGNGMSLKFVARDFERFRSLAAQPAEDPEYHNGKKRVHLSSFDDPNYGQEQLNKEFYPVKPLVQNQEASYATLF